MKNKKIILYIICIVIIIAGLIVTKIKGVNYSLEYQKGKNIEIYFDDQTEKSEIEEIASEVFDEVLVKDIERYSDAFSLKVKDVDDEQKINLVSKINEKYSLEWTNDNLNITDEPKISGIDFIRNYIRPTIISLIIIVVYMLLRYMKIGSVKKTIIAVIDTTLITGAYFGIVLISRMPIVNDYTIPLGLAIALITIFIICYKNEIELEKFKEEQKTKK